MAVLSIPVTAALLLGAFCSSTLAAASKSTHILAERKEAHVAWANSASPRRQSLALAGGTSIEHDHERKTMYWFGNFTVGDGSGLHLLLDTGSSDLLLDPGIYKPSKNQKPFIGNETFSITYEGINKAGTGFETITGNVYMDFVGDGMLSTPEHAIGDIKNYSVQDAPPLKKAIQGDGIMGFIGAESSSFVPPTPSWVYNLCENQALKECRFALAFGTNNKGVTVLGEVDKELFDGDLTVAPTIPGNGFTIFGDVVFDKDLVFKNQTLIIDSGTSNMQAPLNAAKQIFAKLGYGSVATVSPDNTTFLMGFYPCDKPPTLDFSIPAAWQLANPPKGLPISTKSKSFRMLEDQWPIKHNGHDNCTAVLAGTNFIADDGVWLIGQPLLQGHYVDFHLSQSLGFANLKYPHNPTGHL